MGANQNARKLLSTDLVNTNLQYVQAKFNSRIVNTLSTSQTNNGNLLQKRQVTFSGIVLAAVGGVLA